MFRMRVHAFRGLVAVFGVALIAAGATGCDGAGSAEPAPAASAGQTPTQTPPGDPAELVGTWRVDIPGDAEPQWLKLDQEVTVSNHCEALMRGSWRAGAQTFAALIDSGSPDCLGEGADGMSWLEDARGYLMTLSGADLISSDGVVLAHLASGLPTEVPEGFEVIHERTDEAWLAHASPLPNGIRPVTEAELVGRWVPSDHRFQTNPAVTFVADGRYRATDGCNRVAATWALAADGEFSAPVGLQTLVGCDRADIPGWIQSATRVGLDGDELVMVAHDGSELARLVRELPFDAAWLDGGDYIGLVTIGARGCLATRHADFRSGKVRIDLEPGPATECTSSLAGEVILVETPDGWDAREDIQVTVTGTELDGTFTLPGASKLSRNDTNQQPQPSAGWATAPGRLVLLDWGSPGCYNLAGHEVDDRRVVVTFQEGLHNYCHSILAPLPQVLNLTQGDLSGVDTVVLRGGSSDGVRLPIIEQRRSSSS